MIDISLNKKYLTKRSQSKNASVGLVLPFFEPDLKKLIKTKRNWVFLELVSCALKEKRMTGFILKKQDI